MASQEELALLTGKLLLDDDFRTTFLRDVEQAKVSGVTTMGIAVDGTTIQLNADQLQRARKYDEAFFGRLVAWLAKSGYDAPSVKWST